VRLGDRHEDDYNDLVLKLRSLGVPRPASPTASHVSPASSSRARGSM